MPEADVTFSDGRKATISGTRAEIEAAVKTIEAEISSQPPPQKDGISAGESAVKGIGQGATLGFGDEMSGVVSGAMDKALFSDMYKGQTFSDRYRVRRDQRRAENAVASEANPLTYGAAELVGAGGVTAGIGSTATGVGHLARLGGGIGATQGAGYSEGEGADFASDAALGGGIGAGAGAVLPMAAMGLRRFGAPKHPPASTEYQTAAAALKEAGIDLSTGQELGSNWVKMLEKTLSEVPVGGTPMQRMFEGQRRQYQRKLLEMIGLDDGTDLITRSALDKARRGLSARYTKALGGKRVVIEDDAFLDALGDIESFHQQALPAMQKRQVTEIVEDLVDRAANDGSVSGTQYQRMRSFLTKRSRTGDHANLYRDLRDALDDAFERVAGAGKRGVDRQWARYKQLEKIFESVGGPEASEGIMSPARIARSASKQRDPDWEDFTRAAAAVLPDRVGNSGTAQRNYMMNAIAGGGVLLDPVTVGSSLAASRALSNQLAKGRGTNVLTLPQFGVPQINRMSAAPAALPAPLLDR